MVRYVWTVLVVEGSHTQRGTLLCVPDALATGVAAAAATAKAAQIADAYYNHYSTAAAQSYPSSHVITAAATITAKIHTATGAESAGKTSKCYAATG